MPSDKTTNTLIETFKTTDQVVDKLLLSPAGGAALTQVVQSAKQAVQTFINEALEEGKKAAAEIAALKAKLEALTADADEKVPF
jgi:hypothetical protein